VNRTEPHLANPRKCFHGRVSEPRANPYRTGHGRPLESPDNSTTWNPQSATRSMGVAETSPSAGRLNTSRRARPDCLKRAQAWGLDARLHLLGSTECRHRQTCACGAPRPAGSLPMTVEINAPRAGGSREKTPTGALTLLQGFGARPAGPLTRPHRTALATRRDERPISRRQHLRDPNGYTHRCSGATVGDNHEGPLNN
jgi:hypothetical protein